MPTVQFIVDTIYQCEFVEISNAEFEMKVLHLPTLQKYYVRH